jgi:hypothetical protein
VAQAEPVLPELLLEARTRRAGLDARRAGDLVDLQHTVEPPQVDRDRPRVALPDRRFGTPDDPGPSSVGNGSRSNGCAPFQ